MISIGILGDHVTGIELELLLDNEELSTVINFKTLQISSSIIGIEETEIR